jgi:hypothetical protein
MHLAEVFETIGFVHDSDAAASAGQGHHGTVLTGH